MKLAFLLQADAAAITSLVDDFKATKANVGNVAAKDRAITVTGLTYYVGAVSYYKIMIKHDDTSAVTNELGEFGVVRNSVYDINVKKFNNPGYPAIPDPDEGTPDESDEGWLSIEIIPNPWTWYTQEEIM
ncbi:Mfa1 fimbrilin C-terminal domain-containing protein [Bacteroides thetaiotaomicron]|nr:Mfa1 fimbrilin C-terminal domain-containing protein [Bacteroides thetaiotaomicron]